MASELLLKAALPVIPESARREFTGAPNAPRLAEMINLTTANLLATSLLPVTEVSSRSAEGLVVPGIEISLISARGFFLKSWRLPATGPRSLIAREFFQIDRSATRSHVAPYLYARRTVARMRFDTTDSCPELSLGRFIYPSVPAAESRDGINLDRVSRYLGKIVRNIALVHGHAGFDVVATPYRRLLAALTRPREVARFSCRG